MFPLGSVLFPHAPLQLHVFEDRYRLLVFDCLDGDRRFGVVLIDRGSEVGGGDRRTSVGTLAEIAEAQQTEDGRWGVLAVGTTRFDVLEWATDDPYPRAEIVERVERPWSPEADAPFEAAERLVRRSLALLAELDEPAHPIDVELAPERSVASWQLASISPLGPLDRHSLLGLDDPVERMHRLVTLVSEECEVLAHRLASG